MSCIEDQVINHIGTSRYVIFLDIDGTVTSIPGGHSHPKTKSLCLFRWFDLNRDQLPDWTEFFFDKGGVCQFVQIKQFFSNLANHPSLVVIPVTNNYKSAVQKLMAVLGLPVGVGYYRDTFEFNTKGDFINTIVRRLENRFDRFIFYLDDNLDNNVKFPVITINCSRGRWLGDLLNHHVGRPIDFFNDRIEPGVTCTGIHAFVHEKID